MLGTRIASLRQGRGLSQAELASRLHISSSAVGMYEQGRREPSVDTLVAMSQIFGVSLDYLLSGQPDTIRDVTALHRLTEESLSDFSQESANTMSKEEMVYHLLWALLG